MASGPMTAPLTIKKATCTYTTNVYGFVITDEPTSRQVISVYSDAPCVFWPFGSKWVFMLLDSSTATTALKAIPNTQSTFTYYYY